MLGIIEITVWHYVGFIAFVLVCLAVDLGLFHKKDHVVKFREALSWTTVWVCVALLFFAILRPVRGEKEALEFLTGYLIELSLSMDNVFVIALIFAYFKIPGQYQHRVLFWGIMGALIMRGGMIGIGVALIAMISWVLYLFGAFLVFSGFKMMLVDAHVEPDKNPVVRWARMVYPVAPEFDGHRFTTSWNGRRALTPLGLVLIMVETTDLLFAVDSIPAVFAVTTKPFIIFTSNVLAILGLRSLYFVLAGAIGYFRYLKYGLSLVLVFIGVKMLLDPHDGPPKWFQMDISVGTSLAIIAGLILLSMLISLLATWRERNAAK